MSKSAHKLEAVLAATLLAGLAGCDPQAGTDYSGEPLAQVGGTVENHLSETPEDTQAMLVWINSAASPDLFSAETADITGDFPAGFQLDVYEPPDEIMLNDYTASGESPDETRIGIAGIMVAGPNVDFEEGEGLLGVAEDHVLVYVESDVKAGTFSEEFLHGQLKAGFHVMEVVPGDDPSCDVEPEDCLYLAPDDLATDIPVTLDELENLRFPDFK